MTNPRIILSEIAGKTMPSFFCRQLKNPVFIIGSGRSGTTLLNSVLNAHQCISSFPSEANELWHPALYPYHKKTVNVKPIWIDPITYTEKSLALWSKGWDKKICAIFGAFQMLSGSQFFLNKTVMVNFMLDKILEIFPDAKFIHLLRNGWSVALSYQQKEVQKYKHKRYYPFGDIVKNEENIRLMHAKYWNETVKKIEEQKSKLFNIDNFCELRYEDLVENPYKVVEALLAFLNVEMGNTPKFKEIIGNINNRNYKASKNLNETEKIKLKEVLKEGLSMKGYIAI